MKCTSIGLLNSTKLLIPFTFSCILMARRFQEKEIKKYLWIMFSYDPFCSEGQILYVLYKKCMYEIWAMIRNKISVIMEKLMFSCWNSGYLSIIMFIIYCHYHHYHVYFYHHNHIYSLSLYRIMSIFYYHHNNIPYHHNKVCYLSP